jgi:MoxR-like ATPase
MNTVADVHELARNMREQLDRVVIGQSQAKEYLLACLFAGGHALLEGVPGTAKTLLALTMARLLGCTFRRIQFTPDLMPIDLLGTNIFNQKEHEFSFLPGPVFTDVLLADEINRTPPRTQSALLEAMQERAVTIDGIRHALSPAFFVCATQNPIEFEGTYPLPEAQRDRFLLKINIAQPEREDELSVLRAYASGNALHEQALGQITPVADANTVITVRNLVGSQIRCEEKLLAYIRDVVAATRKDESLHLGAGPRASLALLSTCRALAAIRGRDFMTPDDVKELAPPVLTHRVTLAPEAEMEGTGLQEVLDRIFTQIEVPR